MEVSDARSSYPPYNLSIGPIHSRKHVPSTLVKSRSGEVTHSPLFEDGQTVELLGARILGRNV